MCIPPYGGSRDLPVKEAWSHPLSEGQGGAKRVACCGEEDRKEEMGGRRKRIKKTEGEVPSIGIS